MAAALHATAPFEGAVPAATRNAIEALYATGHWLFVQKRWADAQSVFRVMLLCAPTDERGWLALGACHEEGGDTDIALELYGAGRVVARPAGRCEVARARVLRSLGLDDEADDAVARALEIAEEAGDETLRALASAEARVRP
jgi:hypothetical protein